MSLACLTKKVNNQNTKPESTTRELNIGLRGISHSVTTVVLLFGFNRHLTQVTVMNESGSEIASTVVMDDQRIYDNFGRSYSNDQATHTHTHFSIYNDERPLVLFVN